MTNRGARFSPPSSPHADLRTASQRDSDSPDDRRHVGATAEDALWLALCVAPDEGTEVGELMRITG